jgi:hypothetical protein
LRVKGNARSSHQKSCEGYPIGFGKRQHAGILLRGRNAGRATLVESVAQGENR